MANKILQYGDKTQFQLTDSEVEIINNFLANRQGQTHFTFRGQSLKVYKMEVLNEKAQPIPIRLQYHWSDDILTEWEKEIFGPDFEKGILIRKRFNEYLVDLNIINQLDNYTIKDHKMYIELQEKWNQLQDLRYRREKAKGFPTYEATSKKIKEGIKNFADKIGIRDDKLKEKINEELVIPF